MPLDFRQPCWTWAPVTFLQASQLTLGEDRNAVETEVHPRSTHAKTKPTRREGRRKREGMPAWVKAEGDKGV